MKKNILLISLCAILIIVFLASVSFAYDKGEGQKDGLECKFFSKISKVYQNKEELKLTDAQMKQIKDLKIKLKKELIKNKAEIDLVAVDIKSQMYEEDIDVKALNQLVDKKFEFKKDKAKILINSYSQLNKIFTDEQKELLRNIKCKKMMRAKMAGKCMKCMKCMECCDKGEIKN
ncbi:MAG: hypothetical protein ABIG64_03810 [Candidatus Omnitrophota bacterium]